MQESFYRGKTRTVTHQPLSLLTVSDRIFSSVFNFDSLIPFSTRICCATATSFLLITSPSFNVLIFLCNFALDACPTSQHVFAHFASPKYSSLPSQQSALRKQLDVQLMSVTSVDVPHRANRHTTRAWDSITTNSIIHPRWKDFCRNMALIATVKETIRTGWCSCQWHANTSSADTTFTRSKRQEMDYTDLVHRYHQRNRRNRHSGVHEENCLTHPYTRWLSLSRTSGLQCVEQVESGS